MTRSCPSQPDEPTLNDKDLALLRDIAARPRPTAGGAIVAARERCARELREMGYDVFERPFEFSTFPGRFATPLLGAAAAVLVGIVGERGLRGERVLPLLMLLVGVALIASAAWWFATRAILTAPVMREGGINLEATVAGSEPRIWLSAHLDTKSQPVPTLVRSVGVVLESVGVAFTLMIALAAVGRVEVPPYYWFFAGLVTLVGAIPVVLSMVGTRSPGALDNASGVATVIAAARTLTVRSNCGVIITDAEELGLAGARSWSRNHPSATVLNCDGVDDAGAIVVMYSGARVPRGLLNATARASYSTGTKYRPGRLIPGVLTDSVAFSAAGLASVTFSRGSWRSLARVHMRRDDLAHLRGTGIAETAALIAATARDLGAMH